MSRHHVPRRPRISVRVNAHKVVGEALGYAVQRGMNRTDKYHETPLTQAQRDLLDREVVESFWLALDEAGVEVR